MDEKPNSRLEAFCDGVFAIALTLLIIDIRLPASAAILTTNEFWLALKSIVPSVLSFLLSFAIIFITWVNHHEALKLVNKSSPAFVYGNGLLLLGIVIIPFPTALLGDYIMTDHAAPAVILYSAVCAFQAIGWNVLTRAAISVPPLTKNEQSMVAMSNNHNYSYFAFALYSVCAIIAIWFPQAIAIAISLIWILWFVLSITMNAEKRG
ncbi:MAG: DUF1211 domain-containing protein [Candidatus Eremiobacteraeota bacterium]|nr:DUF1211 domain-containing protein [Candidatus Eremiobacteraeota bacterium]